MYWPGINNEITKMAQRCSACLETRAYQQKEPMIPHEIPTKPWQKVGSDLFKFKNNDYIVVVDYFSNFPEIALLRSTTNSSIINHMKSVSPDTEYLKLWYRMMDHSFPAQHLPTLDPNGSSYT